MKIKIIQIGKEKEDYLTTGLDEFIKRLRPFAEVEFVTLRKGRNVKEEGQEILKKMTGDFFSVALDERGKEMNSVDFAKFIEERKDEGRNLCFIIGGPFGLSEEVKSAANLRLSLSQMTFTHQLIRLFLVEQIYRSFCIISGKEYHY